MFCTNCGKQLPDNSTACPFCNASLKPASAPTAPTQAQQPAPAPAATAQAPQPAPAMQSAPTQAQQPAPTMQAAPAQAPQQAPAMQAAPKAPAGPGFFKKHAKLLILSGIGLVVLIAAIVAIILIVGFANRIDITKYIDVSTEGYNGYGQVTYSVDTEKILKEVYKVDSAGELSLKDIQSWSYLSNLTFDVDGNVKNASNGDKVVIKIKNLENVQSKSGLHFNGNDTIEYTVEGLEEPKSFSAADIFDASFTGFNGAGCVVLTTKDDSLPFNVSASWSNVYIDDYYSLTLKTSETEGKLSNGDEFKVTIAEDQYTSEYLLSKYGMYIDGKTEAVFTVSGLGEPDTLDIFSLVDIKVSGVDGKAALTYHWNETEVTTGNLVITADDEDSNSFRISSKVHTPENQLTISDEKSTDVSDELNYIGSFYINADKTNSISGGDTINIIVTSGYSEFSADEYKPYGLVFSEIAKEMKIDSAELDRYITSAEKLNKDNVNAFADTVSESVKEQVLNNWAYYVHDTYSFICYDQEISSCKPAGSAYFVCSSKTNNTYVLCIPFQCKVKDSELDNEKSVYILMKVYTPLITNNTSEIKFENNNNISFEYIKTLTDVSDNLNRIADGDDSIAEIKLK